jgi:hypothetical protein
MKLIVLWSPYNAAPHFIALLVTVLYDFFSLGNSLKPAAVARGCLYVPDKARMSILAGHATLRHPFLLIQNMFLEYPLEHVENNRARFTL